MNVIDNTTGTKYRFHNSLSLVYMEVGYMTLAGGLLLANAQKKNERLHEVGRPHY